MPADIREAIRWQHMPSYGEQDWDQLLEAVAEASTGDRTCVQRHLRHPTHYIGHEMVPAINFNSLNRIVSAFVNAAYAAAHVAAQAEASSGDRVSMPKSYKRACDRLLWAAANLVCGDADSPVDDANELRRQARLIINEEAQPTPPVAPEPADLVEIVIVPIAMLRAAEVGGCFNPHDDTQGECADGDCYCTRQVRREAEAAIAALRGAGALLPAEGMVAVPVELLRALAQPKGGAKVLTDGKTITVTYPADENANG